MRVTPSLAILLETAHQISLKSCNKFNVLYAQTCRFGFLLHPFTSLTRTLKQNWLEEGRCWDQGLHVMAYVYCTDML